MSTVPEKNCNMCAKIGLKPFTRDNVLYYYIPMHGMMCYGALAVNVMNPSLIARVIPDKDVTNVLLLSTLFGTSFFIYSRPHLKPITNGKKAAYSVLGSSLFGLGSILVWAIIRSILPKNQPQLATILGLGSGAIIVKLGTDYFNDCDKLVKK